VKVSDLLTRGRPLVSFEFFPPKTADGEAALVRTIDALRPLGPAFVSVTRTGGKPREATIDLVARIQALGIPGAAHITCIEATRDDIARVLDVIAARGIENMVALRGDVPPDPAFRRPADGFGYAADLVRFVRDRAPALCLAGACHPEGHPETRNLEVEIEHLRAKVDAGLDMLVTNMVYDNAHYFRFVDRVRAAGIRLPIVPGIMPLTNLAQIARIAQLCGCSIPVTLRRALQGAGDDEAAAMDVGIEWGTRQCAELLRGGAPGLHFYTLNKSPATRAIFENLRAERLVP
jgi:methylenetetrahydrofolate reductase (NADPH)